MTLANKITISRFFFIPIIIIFSVLGLYCPYLNHSFIPIFYFTIGQLIALIAFIVGSMTDFLDGYFARKRNEVTTFGKFIDPILDKLLTFTYLLSLLFSKYYFQNNWHLSFIIVCLIIMMCREFMVTALRLVAMDEKVVIPAGNVGKVKTAFFMVTLIYMGFNGFNFVNYLQRYLPIKFSFDYPGMLLLLISTILTIVSGVVYFVNGKEVLKNATRVKSVETNI